MFFYYPRELRLINKRLDTLVKHLTRNGKITDVNRRGDKKRTALHMAAICDREDAVSILLKHGADVNSRDGHGDTALQFAKTAKVARILLEGGADPNAEGQFGATVLHGAVNYSCAEVVACLIEFGAMVDASDLNGEKPLRRARTGDVARILLENGANVNAKCRNGKTALHCAASRGLEDVLPVLIEFGAEVDIRDEDCRTPLHRAGTTKVARVLLEHGADPNTKDKIGRTALHYAVDSFLKEELILVLLEYGADAESQSDDGATPLSLAFDCAFDWGNDCAKGSLLASILLKLANLKVSEENINLVADIILEFYSERLSFNVDEFKIRCVNESNQLQFHKFHGVTSLHRILHTTVPMYLSNRSLVDALSELDLSRYPLYGQLFSKVIVAKTESDKIRYELLLQAKKHLDSLLRTGHNLNGTTLPTLPSELVVKISQYLDNEDLKRVVLCSESIEGRLCNALWRPRKKTEEVGLKNENYSRFCVRESRKRNAKLDSKHSKITNCTVETSR